MQDSILFWNAVSLEANRISFSDPTKAQQQGPTLSSRALAIIHLAMYDAYARVVNNSTNYPPYITGFSPTVPSSPSVEKAVAGAAYHCLVSLYSAQKSFFDSVVSGIEPNFNQPPASRNASFNLGVEVAAKLLMIRGGDPDAGSAGYVFSTARGKHRVDPDNPTQGFHAPFYGARSKVFAVSTRYELDEPPIDDNEYRKALKQVRAKGIKPELMGTLVPSSNFNSRRTPDETVVGIYWGYDGANLLGTPPRLYNQIVRQVAIARGNTEGDNARLFAFVNAAMGDAGILAWQQKYRWDFWRPVLGIREHSTSFGPGATTGENEVNEDADPGWLPLGAPASNSSKKNFTPNFPAYPSGHATFGAAALHVTRLFYGKGFGSSGDTVITGGKKIIKNGNLVDDDLFNGMSFVSDEFNGVNQDNMGTIRPNHRRSFDLVNNDKPSSGGLGKMIIENGRSRVYLGVHWVFDAFKGKGSDNDNPDFGSDGLGIGGIPLGLKIAEDIFKTGGEKAPKMTTNESGTQPPETLTATTLAAAETDSPKAKKAKKTKKAEKETVDQAEGQKFERPYLNGISER